MCLPRVVGRKARTCLVLLSLVTTACGGIRFGGDPPVVRLEGSWSGALESRSEPVNASETLLGIN